MLQIISHWYALSAGLFRHFNIWYVMAPGFLALAPVIGYFCIFEDQNGRRMHRLHPLLRRVITGLAGTVVGVCAYFESRVGLMHLLSGGKTAEQLQDDLGIRFWVLLVAIVATVVYVWALRFVAHQGANQKRELIRRLKAERQADAQEAPSAVADARRLQNRRKPRPAAVAAASQTINEHELGGNDRGGYEGELPRLVGQEAVG